MLCEMRVIAIAPAHHTKKQQGASETGSTCRDLAGYMSSGLDRSRALSGTGCKTAGMGPVSRLLRLQAGELAQFGGNGTSQGIAGQAQYLQVGEPTQFGGGSATCQPVAGQAQYLQVSE